MVRPPTLMMMPAADPATTTTTTTTTTAIRMRVRGTLSPAPGARCALTRTTGARGRHVACLRGSRAARARWWGRRGKKAGGRWAPSHELKAASHSQWRVAWTGGPRSWGRHAHACPPGRLDSRPGVALRRHEGGLAGRVQATE
eukprot:scaffold1845_cov291-Prasinococcus_capsulatus_cf.AAC.2